MVISPHAQRSEMWHSERLGLPTASCFEKIVTTKGEPSKQREKYLFELASEAIWGIPTQRFVTQKMRDAAEREPDARNLYRLKTGYDVIEVGICYKDEKKMFGASPDGLIDPDGGFETKDAEPHIQLMRLEKGWSRADHFQQVQGGMYVCDRQWWDLQSYCEGAEPIIIRFERDEKFIAALEKELESFCFDLAMLIKRRRAA